MKLSGKLYTCKSCSKKKPIQEYYLRSSGTVCEYKCKTCIKKKRQDYSHNNYETVRECNRAAVSKHQKLYPEKNSEKTSRYVAKKLQRMPAWLSPVDRAKIRSIYKYCRAISKKTGTKHHVDHIVPLRGKDVSGLHVPWNLQVIPELDNLKKGNKLYEDMI